MSTSKPILELVTWAVYEPGQIMPTFVEATNYEIDPHTHILAFELDGKIQSVFHHWAHIERHSEQVMESKLKVVPSDD